MLSLTSSAVKIHKQILNQLLLPTIDRIRTTTHHSCAMVHPVRRRNSTIRLHRYYVVHCDLSARTAVQTTLYSKSMGKKTSNVTTSHTHAPAPQRLPEGVQLPFPRETGLRSRSTLPPPSHSGATIFSPLASLSKMRSPSVMLALCRSLPLSRLRLPPPPADCRSSVRAHEAVCHS